jgi:hypothetical protein
MICPSHPYASEQDKLDASSTRSCTQSFRDQADRDYIAARLACRHELFPQFPLVLTSSDGEVPKGILLYNRVKASEVGHDLALALSLIENLPFKIELRPESRKFMAHTRRGR